MATFLANLRESIGDRFFKPSNTQMLTSAADYGVDLTQPIPFTFYICFCSSDDADHVAVHLAEKGYSVARETEEEDPYPFKVQAEISILGNEQEIERQEAFFRGIARELQARYDDYSISYSDEEPDFY